MFSNIFLWVSFPRWLKPSELLRIIFHLILHFLFIYLIHITHFLDKFNSISATKKHPFLRVFLLERMMRIELTTRAWEARILPLNYTRVFDNSITITIIHFLKFYVNFIVFILTNHHIYKINLFTRLTFAFIFSSI